MSRGACAKLKARLKGTQQEMEMAFKAKRQYKRAELIDGVKLHTGAGIEFSTIDNVSAGGLCIRSDHEMKTGAYLEASFTVRSSCGTIRNEVKTLCRVARCIKGDTSFRVGLHFLNLNAEAREQIKNFCGTGQGPF